MVIYDCNSFVHMSTKPPTSQELVTNQIPSKVPASARHLGKRRRTNLQEIEPIDAQHCNRVENTNSTAVPVSCFASILQDTSDPTSRVKNSPTPRTNRIRFQVPILPDPPLLPPITFQKSSDTTPRSTNQSQTKPLGTAAASASCPAFPHPHMFQLRNACAYSSPILDLAARREIDPPAPALPPLRPFPTWQDKSSIAFVLSSGA